MAQIDAKTSAKGDQIMAPAKKLKNTIGVITGLNPFIQHPADIIKPIIKSLKLNFLIFEI